MDITGSLTHARNLRLRNLVRGNSSRIRSKQAVVGFCNAGEGNLDKNAIVCMTVCQMNPFSDRSERRGPDDTAGRHVRGLPSMTSLLRGLVEKGMK